MSTTKINAGKLLNIKKKEREREFVMHLKRGNKIFFFLLKRLINKASFMFLYSNIKIQGEKGTAYVSF